MLDTELMREATENLRSEIQNAESKLKIQITSEGNISTDCLVDLIGNLKAELLSMKCDIILCRSVIFAQDLVISSSPEVSDLIGKHASDYMNAAAERIRKDAEARAKNKSNIIQATSIPTLSQGFKLQARSHKLQDLMTRVQAHKPAFRGASNKDKGIVRMFYVKANLVRRKSNFVYKCIFQFQCKKVPTKRISQ